jgi:hypothetical protein
MRQNPVGEPAATAAWNAIGQSFTPGRATFPTMTSAAGAAHGDHTAPVIAGPSRSAGISIKRRPAARTVATIRYKVATSEGIRLNKLGPCALMLTLLSQKELSHVVRTSRFNEREQMTQQRQPPLRA